MSVVPAVGGYCSHLLTLYVILPLKESSDVSLCSVPQQAAADCMPPRQGKSQHILLFARPRMAQV